MGKTTEPRIMTIEIVATTAVPAEDVLAAASDFSARRVDVFPAVSTAHMTVHALGETTADVTEGTRVGPVVVWERCDYDWSHAGRVSAIVTDSNVYSVPGSAWTITAEQNGNETRVALTWTRGFRRGPLGRFMSVVYRRMGRRSFTKYTRDILRNLEGLEPHAERDTTTETVPRV